MYSRMEKYHGRRAQRFSIRKYSFGAASVLLGTALFLGANGVRADETTPSVNSATSELSKLQKLQILINRNLILVQQHPLLKNFQN